MEDFQIYFALGLLVLLLVLAGKILLKPFKLLFRLLYNSLVGIILLWLANLIGGAIGLFLPLNLVTILIAGFLGIPGVLLLLIMKALMG
ncbi:MAG: pro-sigmaK processing inhibitor BofA family protein [Bacillota bacterium]